jgi:hypothetical protein
MADNKKTVKVKILQPVSGWRPGDIVEVDEAIANHMTRERQIYDGAKLVPFKTAELVDANAATASSMDIANLTVKDMADVGLKNVATPPPGVSVDPATGAPAPRLSTTTNESIPLATGAPLASVQASELDQESQAADEGAPGYDGSNPLSRDRDGTAKAPEPKPADATAPKAGEQQAGDKSPVQKLADTAGKVADAIKPQKKTA